MKLGIDIDGCLANFAEKYAHLIIEVTEKNHFPVGWRVSEDFPPCWDFDTAAGYTNKELAKVWDVIKRSTTFWEKLLPLDGAPETIKQFNRLAKAGYDIYFLTNRIGTKVKMQTEKWLYHCGLDYPTVLLAADKEPLIRALGIEAFIDDKPDTIMDLVQAVTKNREDAKVGKAKEEYKCWDHIYLKDAPYNRKDGQFGVKVVKSVRGMLEKEGLWE